MSATVKRITPSAYPCSAFFEKPLGSPPSAALRLFDELNQLGEGRFGGGLGHAQIESALLVEGAGEEGVARLFPDRQRFAGDRGLIHAARAFDDGAVHGNAFAGPNNDTIADDQFLDSHRDGFRAPLAEGRLGTQFHQRGNGGAAPFNGHFLQGVRERKEKEEDRALEGVVDVGRPERGENHKQIDVDRSGEEGPNPLDRSAPTASEVGREEKPELEFRGQAERGAKTAEEHEDERGGDAEEFRVGPVDSGEKAGHGRRAPRGRNLPENSVGRDGPGRVGDQGLGQGDGEGRLFAHRCQVNARAMPDKTIIRAADGWRSWIAVTTAFGNEESFLIFDGITEFSELTEFLRGRQGKGFARRTAEGGKRLRRSTQLLNFGEGRI